MFKLRGPTYQSISISSSGLFQYSCMLTPSIGLAAMVKFKTDQQAEDYRRQFFFPITPHRGKDDFDPFFFYRLSDSGLEDLKSKGICKEEIHCPVEEGCVGISRTKNSTFLKDSFFFDEEYHTVFYRIEQGTIGGYFPEIDLQVNSFLDDNKFPAHFKDMPYASGNNIYPGNTYPIVFLPLKIKPIITWEERSSKEHDRVKSILG